MTQQSSAPACIEKELEANIPLLSISGIDATKALRYMGGNTTLYRNILLKFASNQGGACQEMARCLASNYAEELERTAHSLKSVAAIIGAMKLADLAGQIEKVSVISEEWNQLPELLDTTTSELTRIISAIEKALV